jgi:putative membrane protein insertion efficiency factor
MSSATKQERPLRILRGLFSMLAFLLVLSQTGLSEGGSAPESDSLSQMSPHSTEETPTTSPLAWPAVALLSLYQRILSPQQGQVCAFQPTCSHFAQKALHKYGLLQGALMTSDRLQRCHQCAAGHYPQTKTGLCGDPINNHQLWGAIESSPLPLPELSAPSTTSTAGEKAVHLAFADHLCTTGDNRRAYGQYLGFARSSPQDPRSGSARLRAGICLQKMGQWQMARDLFANLASQAAGSSLGEEAAFQMALTQLQAGDHAEPLKILNSLEGTSRGDRANLLAGWIQLQHGEWARARSSGERAMTSSHKVISRAGRQVMETAIRGTQLPHRIPLLAASLSAIVPGSGKWYAGKPMDGLYSLLLVGSAATIAYAYEDDHHRAKSAVFGSLGLFFYLGNIFGSASEAKRLNQHAREDLLQHRWASAHPERWLWELRSTTGSGRSSTAQKGILDLAEKLFPKGQYDEAITEYKRHLFHFPEDPQRGVILYKIGLSYLNSEQWNHARIHLRAAKKQAGSEEKLRYRSQLRIGQSFLNQDLPEQSKEVLRDLLRDPIVAGRKDRVAEVQYWLGTGALKSGDWVEALGIFHWLEREVSGNVFTVQGQRLSSAAQKGYHLSNRSPTLAAVLSAVIPGSGQIYCGRFWDGLFSLVLNASVGYLTVDAFRDERRLDGVLLASLLWSRFYFGGQKNAIRYAQEHNTRVLEEHLRKYQPLILPRYQD